MTHEEYLKNKQEVKSRYIAKVFAHSAGIDEDQLYKEASDKFEENYPPYEANR